MNPYAHDSEDATTHGMNRSETVDQAGISGFGTSHTTSSVQDIWGGRYDEALDRILQQRESSMRAVLIPALAITATLAWCIMRNIGNLIMEQQAVYYGEAAVYSHFSLGTSPMAPKASSSSMPHPAYPAIDPSPSRVIRLNVCWIASLAFSLTAALLATLGESSIRDLKCRLVVRRYAPSLRSARIRSTLIDRVKWYTSDGMDMMYRSFQVALVIFLLGHVDAIVMPVGVTVLAPIVIGGLNYVFGVFG
ncbi:hypothetical protein BJV78DRAFT_250618 [Lactifluus subvellereus]|nr:hypothetical protein BJV78DRAFT_1289781 [Lactifluus subvellereus]KAI0245780.1 hypothetical protein BJV78DRAFT_250618 [Lactifluus subvellereus]